MGKTIAISNHKGGPGKTTLSMQILDIASNTQYGYGLKVLAIDADPQGSLTDSLCHSGKAGLFDFVTVTADTRIQITDTLDFISSAGADRIYEELKYNGEPFPDISFSDVLDNFRDFYDLIVIDCPPEDDFLNNMAYMAADEIIVPITSDEYSLKGLILLERRIKKIKRFNPKISIGGIIINRVKMQTNAFKDTFASAHEMAKAFDTKVFNAVIPLSVVVDDAQKNKQSLMQYAPKSTVAQQAYSFVAELLELDK